MPDMENVYFKRRRIDKERRNYKAKGKLAGIIFINIYLHNLIFTHLFPHILILVKYLPFIPKNITRLMQRLTVVCVVLITLRL